MFEGLPVPAQLGIIGALILALVSVLVWQNRQVQTGKLIPADTVARENAKTEAAHAALVAELNRQLAVAVKVGEEWQGAHTALSVTHQATVETLRENTDSTRWLNMLLKKGAETPQRGDNEPEPTEGVPA